MVGITTRLASLLAFLALGVALASAAPPSAPRQANEKVKNDREDKFLRLSRDPQRRPTALETAIVHCRPLKADPAAPTVDLIAAIHIADAAYYRQLNREFEQYDVVLYELVASEDMKVPRPDDAPGNNPISLIQNGMKDLLALEFQLKGIDYRRKNMLHADMSPEQFAESMRQRGETVMTILARMIGYEFSRRNKTRGGANDMDLLMALFDDNRALALKRALAEQFTNSEEAMMAMDGPQGSTLISGRNQKALEVLRKQLAAEKKKIAIFYGAAHMPDFEKRLRDEFKLAPANTRWLVAWDLKDPKPEAAAKPRLPGGDRPTKTSQPRPATANAGAGQP